MRRRQVEQTQEEERERSTKESGARVKIFNATSPPPSLPRLLADNYTSRSYKELGRSKLKASKISFPFPREGRGKGREGSQACLSELENARFSPRCATVGNSWWRKKWREKEGGVGRRLQKDCLPQLHASSNIVIRRGSLFSFLLFSFFSFFRDINFSRLNDSKGLTF